MPPNPAPEGGPEAFAIAKAVFPGVSTPAAEFESDARKELGRSLTRELRRKDLGLHAIL